MDPEALFAVSFGWFMKRDDWWKLRKEHTPFQWMLQRVASQVIPFGEERADKRAAVCTANLMRMQAAGEVSDDDFSRIVSALANYLPTADAYEDVADLEALKQMKAGKSE